MSVTQITDWPHRLRSRVYQQFANAEWTAMLADTIGAGANELEAAFAAMLLLWSIEPVTDDEDDARYGIGRGVQLDRIGRLVGQARGAAGDSTYRLMLRARVLVNQSVGDGNRIIAIAKAMFAGEGSPLIIPGWIAEYTVRFVGVVMLPEYVPAVLDLIGKATQAGTRVVVEWTGGTLILDSLVASEAIGDFNDATVGGSLGGAASPS